MRLARKQEQRLRQTGIRMEESLYERVRIFAAVRRTSMQEIVALALTEYLDRHAATATAKRRQTRPPEQG